MGLRDLSSDTHSNREASDQRDFLRLLAKGKRPASQEENKIPVGEDGKPLAKLQLDPKREGLLGGMHRGDQARTSGRMRAEDLARMSASEQVNWCVQGGLAQAFGPDGDSALAPVMLRNNQIDNWVRRGIANGMIIILASHYNENSVQDMMDMLHNDQIDNLVRRDIANGMGTILASNYNENRVQDMMGMLRNDQIDYSVRNGIANGIGTILASNYNENIIQDMENMLRDEQIHYSVRNGITNAMEAILSSHYNENIIQDMMNMLPSDRISPLVRNGIANAMGTILTLHYNENRV